MSSLFCWKAHRALDTARCLLAHSNYELPKPSSQSNSHTDISSLETDFASGWARCSNLSRRTWRSSMTSVRDWWWRPLFLCTKTWLVSRRTAVAQVQLFPFHSMIGSGWLPATRNGIWDPESYATWLETITGIVVYCLIYCLPGYRPDALESRVQGTDAGGSCSTLRKPNGLVSLALKSLQMCCCCHWMPLSSFPRKSTCMLWLRRKATFLIVPSSTYRSLKGLPQTRGSMMWRATPTIVSEQRLLMELSWRFAPTPPYGSLFAMNFIQVFKNIFWVFASRSTEKQRLMLPKEMIYSLGYPCRPQQANCLGTVPWLKCHHHLKDFWEPSKTLRMSAPSMESQMRQWERWLATACIWDAQPSLA